jgi:hypothetical protein
MLLDVQRTVYVRIKEIEDERQKQMPAAEEEPVAQLSNRDPQRVAIQSTNVVVDPSNPRKVFHKDSQRRMWKTE